MNRGNVAEDRIGDDEGGESACFAHLICTECGVVPVDSDHVPGCTWFDTDVTFDPKAV
jgi:hypothetical protein